MNNQCAIDGPKTAPSHRGAMPTDEGHFRAVADNLPALVAIMSARGELESVNQRVLDYFGRGLEQLHSWGSDDSIHPDDREAVIAAWSHALETELPYDVEHRMRRADGVYRWFRVHGQPLRSGEGGVGRWCVLCTDIDEHKRIELLSRGEKRLLEMIALGEPLAVTLDELCRTIDSVADGCTSGVLVLDRANRRVQYAVAPGLPATYSRAIEGQVVSLEQGPCGMAATLKAQVIVVDTEAETRWDSDGWPALARAHGVRSCWSSPALSTWGEPLGTFAVYQHSPGSPTPFHSSLMQKFAHVVSLAIQRKRHEDALRRKDALLAGAEMLSATGCFSLEPASGEHWWSAQTYRIFDVEPGRVPSIELLRERIYFEDLELLNHAWDCANRGEGFSIELRVQRPDGTLKYVQLLARGTTERDGEEQDFVGAVRDVTDRRLSEEALGKAQAELAHVSRVATLGVLTASIAHEVNQPLCGIATNASTCLLMLEADPPNVEGACNTARRTLRDCKRAFSVVATLRDLFANKPAAAGAVDLNDATREVLALLGSELRRKRISVRTQLAPDLPAAQGDRAQLQQVILNLIVNAADAMSSVELGARQLWLVSELDSGSRVRLTVRDTGVGLGATPATRIFEPFYTTKSTGMGVGLSVSKSIIESHHGSIWAASNDDGRGSAFMFSLPIHDD